MTPPHATPSDPWWASGRTADDGIDPSEDPFDAHRDARRGAGDPPPGPHDAPAGGAGATGGTGEAGRLAAEAVDLFGRLAAEAGRRVTARATANAAGPHGDAFTRPDPPDQQAGPRDDDGVWRRLAEGIGPHDDGQVCDACPVCIGLRALRQVRPEVIAHLSDAAHHLSLALRAVAEAQTGQRDGFEKIDLDL